MGAPALGIGQFLAAALGTMAVGGLSGMAQMKMKENADAKTFTMQLIQKALFDKMMGGVDIPDETLKLAVGGNAELFKQVRPAVAGLSQMMRQQRAEGMAGVFVGQPGAVADGGEAPSLAPTPSIAPQAGDILGAMAGAPQAQPAIAPTPFEQTIQPQPEPGAPQPGQLRPGLKSFTRQVPGIGTATYESSDEQRIASVMKWGYDSGAAPKEVLKQAARHKLTIPKAVYDQYAETHFNQNLPKYLAQVAVDGVVGPAARQQALMKYGYDSGYTPSELKTMLLPDQASSDAWFAHLRAVDGGKTPLAKLFETASILGISVSPDARKQATEAATASATSAALARDPTLRGNPSALARTVWEALGYSAQSPEAAALMNQLAPVSAQTAEQLTMQGKAQPLAANVGAPPAPAGAPTGETGVTSALDVQAAKRGAEITAAREAEKLTTAREVGKAKGEEEAKKITTITEYAQLSRYINPRTGEMPPPGLTQEELNKRVADGTYGMLSVPREEYVGYQQIDAVLDLYKPMLARPGNIFSKPAGKRILARLASGPWGFHVPGFKDKWELPPIESLRDKKLGLTEQDIKDMMQIVTNQNLGVAHLRALGEKGQGITSKLYERGITSFPGFMDDTYSAQAKVDAFRAVVKTRLDLGVSMAVPKAAAPSTYKGWTITPKGP